jgi:hypothetical protein
MKYVKKYKIFESLNENEILDIFQDVIDDGIRVDAVMTSKDPYIYIDKESKPIHFSGKDICDSISRLKEYLNTQGYNINEIDYQSSGTKNNRCGIDRFIFNCKNLDKSYTNLKIVKIWIDPI